MSVCPWHQMLLATGVKPSFFFFFQFPLISATDTQEGINVALTPFLSFFSTKNSTQDSFMNSTCACEASPYEEW